MDTEYLIDLIKFIEFNKDKKCGVCITNSEVAIFYRYNDKIFLACKLDRVFDVLEYIEALNKNQIPFVGYNLSGANKKYCYSRHIDCVSSDNKNVTKQYEVINKRLFVSPNLFDHLGNKIRIYNYVNTKFSISNDPDSASEFIVLSKRYPDLFKARTIRIGIIEQQSIDHPQLTKKAEFVEC